jgi:hypothetical protein
MITKLLINFTEPVIVIDILNALFFKNHAVYFRKAGLLLVHV